MKKLWIIAALLSLAPIAHAEQFSDAFGEECDARDTLTIKTITPTQDNNYALKFNRKYHNGVRLVDTYKVPDWKFAQHEDTFKVGAKFCTGTFTDDGEDKIDHSL